MASADSLTRQRWENSRREEKCVVSIIELLRRCCRDWCGRHLHSIHSAFYYSAKSLEFIFTFSLLLLLFCFLEKTVIDRRKTLVIISTPFPKICHDAVSDFFRGFHWKMRGERRERIALIRWWEEDWGQKKLRNSNTEAEMTDDKMSPLLCFLFVVWRCPTAFPDKWTCSEKYISTKVSRSIDKVVDSWEIRRCVLYLSTSGSAKNLTSSCRFLHHYGEK